MASRAVRRAALLGTLAVTLGSASPAPPANYDAFGFALLGDLARAPGGNVFVSPLSLGMALSMAGDGAAGDTQAAIRQTLHSSADPGAANAALEAELRANADATIGVANALWLRSDAPPSDAYVAHLADAYGATARALSFGDPSAAQTINEWTKAHTLGLIDRLVESTQRGDALYLTNAVAFHAQWGTAFDKSETVPEPFTAESGAAHPVEMMNHTARYEIARGDGFRMLRLPYGSGGFAAYVLLPDRNAVGEFAATFEAKRFDAARAALAPELTHVGLPRFSATYHASLGDALAALGMGIVFSDRADFSGMRAPPPRLAVSGVDHATYVRVDEQGTTAAAATSIGMRTLAMPAPAQRFVADRPFMFLIRDEKAGTLLFAGIVREIAPDAHEGD